MQKSRSPSGFFVVLRYNRKLLFYFDFPGNSMPIYAYACDDCGHAQDFLQKMSDPLIAICPGCGSVKFHKQLTAAGFHLKGGGWYVTDFRDSGKKDAKKPDTAEVDAKTESASETTAASETKTETKAGTETKADGKTVDAKSTDKKSTDSAPAATPAAAPATKPPSSPSAPTKAA